MRSLSAQRLFSSPRFLDWKREDRPVDWPVRFGRMAPLEVEIGFGDGAFLMEQALAHPDRDFVGVESKPGRVVKGLRRLDRASPSNVCLLCVDAEVALERLFAQKSLSRVYSLFCDPWPKKKHFKFRLFSRPFLRLLNSRLLGNGQALIVTDHSPFFDWILDQLEGGVGFDVESGRVPPRFGSRFERIWQSGGQEEFFQVRLRKTRHHQVALKRDASLKERRVATRGKLYGLRPSNARGDTVVQFKTVEIGEGGIAARLMAIVVDGRLIQRVWLDAGCSGGETVVRARSEDGLVPTEGVQKAIDLVADSLRLLGPG